MMDNLLDFALRERYDKVKALRPWLEEMNRLLDWNAFLLLFPDKETTRGRPAYETTLKLKILFLQSWYGISDQELEFQINDRLSFQQFLLLHSETIGYMNVHILLPNHWKSTYPQDLYGVHAIGLFV